ncbi:MAG: hypothetical protein EPN20_07690 [Magnetospirillum sp.]|nr:MAG: hypothetical protein EPN20_07690 [Magnetospirillum sp.]
MTEVFQIATPQGVRDMTEEEAAVFAAERVQWAAAQARREIIEKMTALERTITDRIWREHARGSAVVMRFPPITAEDGFPAPDPRDGKTASEYIAWVDDRIAALRDGAGL